LRTKGTRIALSERISGLQYLPNRTPEIALAGGAEAAFADELVMALGGNTILILLEERTERRIELSANDIAVVLRNTWHRFENSRHLEVLTVTPQPTDHSVQRPGR
jgi:hypothetical protein